MFVDRDALFDDRVDAGRRLGGQLGHLRGPDTVVVGLPRGGVPVAAEVARALDAPLDVILVRKLGAPFQPELAIGAIGEDGVRVINEGLVRDAGVLDTQLAEIEARERAELERRVIRYRSGRGRMPLAGRLVVLVDDGVATGSTARAACEVASAEGASRVVLAVPVAPPDWRRRLAGVADELICVATPEPFYSVGQFYADFGQTTDDTVVSLLRQAARTAGTDQEDGTAPLRDETVVVGVESVQLGGRLTVPEDARGLVIFAHGSGSSRHSPRNRFVATELNRAGLATLLFDLLTPEEEPGRANVFDIELLGRRLALVTDQVVGEPGLKSLPVGYFGASTGAAAALAASTETDVAVSAIVSRGGRPDLAASYFTSVTAPTLLIVGGRDEVVLDLNRRVQRELQCPCELEIVPGATHLFTEAGALATVADLATGWFVRHLAPDSRSTETAGR